MNKRHVTLDLNRNKAIDMLIELDSRASLNFSVNIDLRSFDLEEIDFIIEQSMNQLGDLKDEAKDNIKELKKFRKELESKYTHEIYELGEKRGLWKVNEKQKRLI